MPKYISSFMDEHGTHMQEGMTATQACLLQQSSRVREEYINRLKRDMWVEWEYSPIKLTYYLYVRIGEYKEEFEAPKVSRIEDMKWFLDDIYWIIRANFDEQTAELVVSMAENKAYPRPLQKNADEARRIAKEMEEKNKEKYLLSSIYCSWLLLYSIPVIPEEVLSAFYLAQNAMKIEKKTTEDMLAHLEDVKEHKRKYGTLWEKIYTYLK